MKEHNIMEDETVMYVLKTYDFSAMSGYRKLEDMPEKVRIKTLKMVFEAVSDESPAGVELRKAVGQPDQTLYPFRMWKYEGMQAAQRQSEASKMMREQQRAQQMNNLSGGLASYLGGIGRGVGRAVGAVI